MKGDLIMRKNKTMRAAAVLAVAALLTTSALSGTFAKYTSTASGSDSARVAKWSFKVGDTDIVTTNSFTFNLFETVKDTNTTDAEMDVATATTGNDTIIAPGTSGSFEISLENASEVTAKYSIAFTENRTNDDTKKIPIEYSIDNTDWKTDVTQLNINDETLGFAADSKTASKTVYWRWAYESNDTDTTKKTAYDTNDTTLGAAGNATVTVQATITATQVD